MKSTPRHRLLAGIFGPAASLPVIGIAAALLPEQRLEFRQPRFGLLPCLTLLLPFLLGAPSLLLGALPAPLHSFPRKAGSLRRTSLGLRSVHCLITIVSCEPAA